MNETINGCEGCYVKGGCFYKDLSTICPCSTCIVKMICRDICDGHKDFQIKAEDQDAIFTRTHEGKRSRN